ncbi:transporter [Salinisphaera sp. T5B8]|uniref:NRAMP family divalent metal transporter n=1 Tax=Salinisphaera sp. T5B8 TaxID=1304154 RepID=UPI00333FA357
MSEQHSQPSTSSNAARAASPRRSRYLAAMGPGFLFAGAAIGTSHVVQATRAGADYGTGLLAFILLAILIKYPCFYFGPLYASKTGNSLVEGYRQTFGKSVVALFGLVQIPVFAIIVAAIAITTAGVGGNLLGIGLSGPTLATVLIVACCVIIYAGGYAIVDAVNKLFIAILSVTTLIATALALPNVDWSFYPSTAVSPLLSHTTFVTLVAVLGFMPSGLSLSIVNSLWSLARNDANGMRADSRQERADFDIGYIGSALIAACFVIMGAGVLHSQNINLATGSVGFASQVVDLYVATLGPWSGFVVGISIFTVLLTTLLTVLDGFPRVVVAVFESLGRDEASPQPEQVRVGQRQGALYLAMAALSVLAVLILYFLMSNFWLFINFAMITSAVISPLLAALNHFTINGVSVAPSDRPSALLNAWSGLAIVTLAVLSLCYLYVRFLS